MNTHQAKQLDLPAILEKLGHKPITIRKGGNEYWYLSPFRTETEPSFIVSRGRILPWVWNDFGDHSGTVVDFALRYLGTSDIKHALEWLSDINIGRSPSSQSKSTTPTLFSSNQQEEPAKPVKIFENELAFIKAGPVRNEVLLNYLHKERCIPLLLVERYLSEVLYRHRSKNKVYFAFGMQNRTGGYEIRAASDEYKFKSALNGRDISLIEGKSQNQTVNLFEGMLDFLSLLAMLNVDQLAGDVIVMHSLSSYKPCAKAIEDRQYSTINTFLDNNEAGRGANQRFIEDFPKQVRPQSEMFAPYEDVNDALKSNFKPSFAKMQRKR